MKKHEKTHIGNKPFECVVCDKKFTSAAHLKRHEMSHTVKTEKMEHDDIKVKNAADSCGESDIFEELFEVDSAFYDLCDLRQHTEVPIEDPIKERCLEKGNGEKIHSVQKFNQRGEKSFCCLTCGKKFPSAPRLRRHARIHTGDLFGCKECEKKFTTASNLKVHERIHTGDLFNCTKCNKKFTRAFHLKTHEESRTSDTFNCTKCEKKFATPFQLKRHQRLHMSDLFNCTICDSKFTRKKNLRAHEKIHSDRLLNCVQCDKKFHRSDLLKKHKERMHNEDDINAEF